MFCIASQTQNSQRASQQYFFPNKRDISIAMMAINITQNINHRRQSAPVAAPTSDLRIYS